MAEKDYYSDLYATPIETPLGTAGNIIAQNLPAVVNPYASTGANFAAVLGGGLLAGLLAYGAKREAEAQNRELTPKLLDVMSATNQAELQQKLAQPGYEQLGGLGTRLQSALVEQQRKQAIEQAKQDAQLQRQMQIEDYKATLMNNPQVQEALRTRLQIESQYAPQTLAATPPTPEQIQQEAEARAFGTQQGINRAALTTEGQAAAQNKSERKVEEEKQKQAVRSLARIEALDKKAQLDSATEEQRQTYRKEIEQIRAASRSQLADKQIANRLELFERKVAEEVKKQRLPGEQQTKVNNLMDMAGRALDTAQKMRAIPNYGALKLAELLPMFDDDLTIADLRDLTSITVISRTGAAAAVEEYKRLQNLIQNPRATPSQLVAQLERFAELSTNSARLILTNSMKTPGEILTTLDTVYKPVTKTLDQLRAEYKDGKISRDEYAVQLNKLKAGRQ